MVSLRFSLWVFLAAFTAVASPLPLNSSHAEILCQIPIAKWFLCPRQGSDSLAIPTVLGVARGTLDPYGAYRFVAKYANANRWQPSSLVSSWALPTGAASVASLPLTCPQADVDPSSYIEDCLSMILYIPPSLTTLSNVPTLVWIHGGSFVAGSATAPGLNGSKFAIATNSIVAVIQYRLGALGFMAPNSATNLAVGDVINSLQFLKRVVPAFGGSNSKITLAGQSSGADMIRSLLAAPSASSLFESAILQSDPMNYGFLSNSAQRVLQANYTARLGCAGTDNSCLNSLSLDTILTTQTDFYETAVDVDPSAGAAQPMRPVLDGSLIVGAPGSTNSFPFTNKPLLLSTVKHEAAFAIYRNFPQAVPEDYLAPICQATFGLARTEIVLNSPFYRPSPDVQGDVDARTQLQLMGTDYMWRCSSWTFARNWVQKGGTVFMAHYSLGASYAGNEAVPFCTQPGSVCHQDDIQIVFGTVSNPTAAQSNLITQVQKRYKSFLATGDPNVPGLPAWRAAGADNLNVLNLGGTSTIDVGACDTNFWGNAVEYDYQFYGL